MKGGSRITILLALVIFVCLVVSLSSCGPTPEPAYGPSSTTEPERVYYEWQKIDGPGDCESYILYYSTSDSKEYSTGCIAMWCDGTPTLACR